MEGVEEKKQQLRLISISFSHLLYHMFTPASSAWEYNSNYCIRYSVTVFRFGEKIWLTNRAWMTCKCRWRMDMEEVFRLQYVATSWLVRSKPTLKLRLKRIRNAMQDEKTQQDDDFLLLCERRGADANHWQLFPLLRLFHSVSSEIRLLFT